MQGKNIKVHLKRKIGDWVSSVDDEAIKDAISDNLYLDFTENPKRYIRTTISSIVLHIGRAGITH